MTDAATPPESAVSDPAVPEADPAAPDPVLPDLGSQVEASGRRGAVFGAKTFDGQVYVTFSQDGPWLPFPS
jgi:hypothetical protein